MLSAQIFMAELPVQAVPKHTDQRSSRRSKPGSRSVVQECRILKCEDQNRVPRSVVQDRRILKCSGTGDPELQKERKKWDFRSVL